MKPRSETGSAFRVGIVRMILDGRPEEALCSLSSHYEVEEPDLRVGTVKRHRKVLAVYVHKEKRIYVSKSDLLRNPFVILHEFYHHLVYNNVIASKREEREANDYAKTILKRF